jgi:hypothetical protein
VKIIFIPLLAAALTVSGCLDGQSQARPTLAPISAAASGAPELSPLPAVGEPRVLGAIADSQIDASIPAKVTGMEQVTIRRLMRTEPRGLRHFMRWAHVRGTFVVWLQYAPGLGGEGNPARDAYKVLNVKASNLFYQPGSGKLLPVPG